MEPNMEPNKINSCKFCGKNVHSVHEEFYFNKNTGDYLCYNCGYSPEDANKQQHSEPQSKELQLGDKEQIMLDLKYFNDVFPYLCSWRLQQIRRTGATTKELSNIRFETYLLKLEEKLQAVKGNFVKGKKAETFIGLVDLIVLAISFFESHPFELLPDA